MGIPSYYKKLSDKIKGLIIKSKPVKPRGLYLDFNCLIYHCAKRPNTTLPPYPGHDGKIGWENLLLDDIVRYVVKLWTEAGKPPEVLLAVDGVVPMAKIKQQRLRRFKSIWLAAEEKKQGVHENVAAWQTEAATGSAGIAAQPRVVGETWDTNCITPGTNFMRRLGSRLSELCAKRPGWKVSAADEPGEGEHKVMNILRSQDAEGGPVIIYGLDADLILLTLMNAKSQSFLMREDSEMGIVQLNGLQEETFSYFSIDVLKQAIWSKADVSHDDVCEYVAAMSLLGNDFVPHSLTVKIKDDGHTFLIEELAALHSAGMKFVHEVDGKKKIHMGALLWLFKRWALVEEERLLHTVKRKLQMKGRVDLRLMENMPLEWSVEQPIVHVQDGKWSIISGWQDYYRKEWLFCNDKNDIDKCCGEYIYGLQWVLDYYTGQTEVNKLWLYPRLVTPLWCDLATYMGSATGSLLLVHPAIERAILPHEQLAMVLPLESWHLLEDKGLRSLPATYPHYWPSRFGFFSPGRIRLWECEPLIPLISLDRLR